MTETCQLLTHLTIDPYLCQTYASSPHAVLNQLGANASDLLACESQTAPSDWAICACCSDPGPDPMPGDDDDGKKVDSAAYVE